MYESTWTTNGQEIYDISDLGFNYSKMDESGVPTYSMEDEAEKLRERDNRTDGFYLDPLIQQIEDELNGELRRIVGEDCKIYNYADELAKQQYPHILEIKYKKS